MNAVPDDPDPVLARRARIGRLAALGQRGGYALFGVSIAVFVVGVITGFSQVVVIGVVGALAAGSVLFVPAIVLGYAVKAADREDRERGHAS